MKKIFFITTLIILNSNIFLFSQLKPNQLRVNGRNLLDGNGQVIRLVGINHGHAWYRGYLGSALQGIKSWGANSVRVVLSCGYRWTKIPAHEVSAIISEARNLGFKAIVLEVHDTTGYGEDSAACDLQTAVNYWIEIKNVLIGHEDFVIINIGNEPWGNLNTSGWVNATKNAISALRNAGFTHVIMVDAPCWGQDWNNTMRYNATNVLSADTLNNTILSVHMYGVYNTASKVQYYLSYYYNNNLPLCIGEFGHYHSDGDPDEQAIVNYARQYGMSIFGWSWCGNSGGVEYLDMVYNWNPNSPTNWGSWYKNNALSDLPQTYTISININPQNSGSVTLSPPGGTYTAGTQVTLTAQANSGYVFSSWSGDITGSQNPATVVMNSNKNITANFIQSTVNTYRLSLSISPSGSGVVYLNPSGGLYIAGTQVTLTAQPNSGYVFNSWSGDLSGSQNPASIVMDSNKSITANFVQSGSTSITYTLNITISPQQAGKVSVNPVGGVYQENTQVEITAFSNNGYVFSGWSGDITTNENPLKITMNSNKNITANFSSISSTTYTVTVIISPQNAGFVYLNPIGGVYTAGTLLTLVAYPQDEYEFLNWSGDIFSEAQTVSIVVDSNKVIQANFILKSSTAPFSDQKEFLDSIIILPPSENPFYLNKTNSYVKLKYYLKQSMSVRLKVYDVSLNLVRITEYQHNQAGENYFIFDAKDDEGYLLPAGLYLYQIESHSSKSSFGKIFIVR
ncbi:MAG: cellulase family glycosylhydrolase [Endomicrobiia bacterium]